MTTTALAEQQPTTDRQDAFVAEFVASGCTPTEAARRAGFAAPGQEAYRLMRKPHVMAALRLEREKAICGLANTALLTLDEVMKDKTAPAAARVSASRTVLEMAGHFQLGDEGRDTPAHEMTETQLIAFIAKQKAIEAKGGAPAIITVIPG